MKKILLLVILLLLFPIGVYAKTPTKDEALEIIGEIENVLVDENIKIESTTVTNDKIIFKINGIDKEIPYTYENNKFSFTGGYYSNGNIYDNEYAFYLYSILENKSTIPYDEKNYYNNNKIKEMIDTNYKDSYKEETNTFGITLKKENEKINIIYNYYLDGDYPVMEMEETKDELTNPATGNYNFMITVMLICVLSIGAYTVMDPKKSK